MHKVGKVVTKECKKAKSAKAKSFRLNILGSAVPLAMFRYLSPVLVSDKTRSTIHVARVSHCKE